MTTSPASSATDNFISKGRRNIAIAEIVIFATVQLIQFPIRYMQEWRYWHHRKNQKHPRCTLYSWLSMAGLLSHLRIASSAMILHSSHPDQGVFIAENAMQSVGLSPILFEVSLVLLRCGQTGEYGPGNSKWPFATRIMIHLFRFPIFISIVLAVVGRIIDINPVGEVGSIVLVVSFAFVCGLVGWLAVKSRSTLPVAGHRGVLLTLLTLPFLLVRVIYFLLQQYGPEQYKSSSGDVGILASMGLLMEIIVIVLLLAARAVVEPIRASDRKRSVSAEDNAQV